MNENVQTISHRTAQERLLLARHGELSLSEKQQLDAHLSGCAACRAYATQQGSLRAGLQRSNPAHNAPIPGGLPDAAKLNAHTRRVKMINQTKSSTQWIIRAGLTAVIVLLLAWVVQSRVVLRFLAGYDRQPGMPATITHINERVLPSPNYVSTAVQAPIAWQVSRGAGVKVGVIQNHTEDLTVLNLIAPDAELIPLQVDAQFRVDGRPLKNVLAEQGIRLLVILHPNDFYLTQALETWQELTAAGVLVISVADQTLTSDIGYVIDAGDVGVLVVGVSNVSGQLLGAYTTVRFIQLYAPDLQGRSQNAPLVAAGVAALVLGVEPDLSPAELYQRLMATADKMYTASSSKGEWNPNNVRVDPKTGDYSLNPDAYASAYSFRRLNAARAVGARLDTIWPVNALNAPAAWKTATGKGVTVAVLDQGFHTENPLFKGHLVDKAAFVEGKTFEGEQNFHGTAMAKIVLNVAPDASLQFLLTDERADEDVKKAYVDAIDYAIAHGAKVITSSAGPWPNTPEVHAAIDRAIAAGVVYVWFHYNGSNPAVIRPGYYWDSTWEVGAFDRFFDSDKPSELEGGLSCTAPQIAGIAALILQNEPDLTPMQVKQRIVETATILPGGFSLADAAAAVENRSSGWVLPAKDAKPLNGRMILRYQKLGANEKVTFEIIDQQPHSPLAILPPADVVMYENYRNNETTYYSIEGYSENDKVIFWIETDANSLLGTSAVKIAGFRWEMNWLANDRLFGADLSAETGDTKVTVDGEHVHFHWESTDGLPIHWLNPQNNYQPTDAAAYRLYEIDVEGDFLPMAVVSQTGY